jgi:Mn-containing catalase
MNELRANLHYKNPVFTIDPLVFHDMDALSVRGTKHQIHFNKALNNLEIKNIELYHRFVAIINNKFNFQYD